MVRLVLEIVVLVLRDHHFNRLILLAVSVNVLTELRRRHFIVGVLLWMNEVDLLAWDVLNSICVVWVETRWLPINVAILIGVIWLLDDCWWFSKTDIERILVRQRTRPSLISCRIQVRLSVSFPYPISFFLDNIIPKLIPLGLSCLMRIIWVARAALRIDSAEHQVWVKWVWI